MANYKIVTLPGDGIGPDIVREAVKVLHKVGDLYGHKFEIIEKLMGGCAIDQAGCSLPQDTIDAALASDAVLLGAVGGPKYSEDRVYGKDYVDYTCKFWANELAEVIVIGDGDNDLDLYIYDANGNLIASDTDYTDQCVCRWVPSWTGAFTIRIVNRGAIYSNFAIATN